MILQKPVKEILKKIAKQHDITYEEAEKIWLYQWKMFREVLDASEVGKAVDTFKFPKWGRYYTSAGQKRRLYVLNKLKEEKIKKRKDNERLLLDALDRTDTSNNK